MRTVKTLTAAIPLWAATACSVEEASVESFEPTATAAPDSVAADDVAPGGASETPEDPQATKTILKRSAALLEGTVSDITYTYDERTGPRTVVTLEVSTVHSGAHDAPQIELRMFGGPTPDGHFVSMSESVDFVMGARYLLFVRNHRWFYSPLPSDAVRVESVSGREVLIDPHGHALKGLGPRGFHWSDERLFLDERPNGTVRTAATRVTNADELLAGTLERGELMELLNEAMDAEGARPSGRFRAAPDERESWRVERAAADTQPASKPVP